MTLKGVSSMNDNDMPIFLIIEKSSNSPANISAAFSEESAIKKVREAFASICKALHATGEMPPIPESEIAKVKLIGRIKTKSGVYEITAHKASKTDGNDVSLIVSAAQSGSIEALMWVTYMGLVLPCVCGTVPAISNWQCGYEFGTTIKCPHCGTTITQSNSTLSEYEHLAIVMWNSQHMLRR